MKLAVPTAKRTHAQSFDEDDTEPVSSNDEPVLADDKPVSSDADDDLDPPSDTGRQRPSGRRPLRLSVHRSSGRSVLTGQRRGGGERWVLGRVYAAVPATCACFLLSVTVFGVLLLIVRRYERSDERQHPNESAAVDAALLPTSCTSMSSPVA